MSANWMNRRLLLTSLCAIATATPGIAQHTDEADTTHGSDQVKGRGAGGAMHGRPEDAHSGEDDHGDDQTSNDGHDTDHTSDEDHDSDHGSGGKGKGPKYKGGRSVVHLSGGRGHSLEDRVLRTQPFE